MYLNKLIDVIERKFAPEIIDLNFDFYGLQYGTNDSKKVIKKVLLTRDLTNDTIYVALKNKVNLIISLNPLFNRPISNINDNLRQKLILLSKFPVSVYILNKSFNFVEGGILDTLIESLYLQLERMINIKVNDNQEIPFGRICSFNNRNDSNYIKLKDLMERVQLNLNMKFISYFGKLDATIKNVCIFEKTFLDFNINLSKKIFQKTYDCYISSHFTHEEITNAMDEGINLIKICKNNNEIIALKKLSNYLSLEFPYSEFMVFESKSPFDIFL
jgi:putative NIF3 family GTP cyclohydrolase 1 type 2